MKTKLVSLQVSFWNDEPTLDPKSLKFRIYTTIQDRDSKRTMSIRIVWDKAGD